jgi:hypothetical protein
MQVVQLQQEMAGADKKPLPSVRTKEVYISSSLQHASNEDVKYWANVSNRRANVNSSNSKGPGDPQPSPKLLQNQHLASLDEAPCRQSVEINPARKAGAIEADLVNSSFSPVVHQHRHLAT